MSNNGKKGPATEQIPESELMAAAAAGELPIQNPPPPALTADATLLVEPGEDFDMEAYQREVERIRKQRKPFGAFSQKLALEQRRGYKRHWFNDTPGRIEEKLREGWTHVKDREGKPVKRVVGGGRNNAELIGFAMEIPVVIWEEEQAAYHREAQARMDDIRRNPVRAPSGTTHKSDANKFYSPREEMVRIIEDPVPRSVI